VRKRGFLRKFFAGVGKFTKKITARFFRAVFDKNFLLFANFSRTNFLARIFPHNFLARNFSHEILARNSRTKFSHETSRTIFSHDFSRGIFLARIFPRNLLAQKPSIAIRKTVTFRIAALMRSCGAATHFDVFERAMLRFVVKTAILYAAIYHGDVSFRIFYFHILPNSKKNIRIVRTFFKLSGSARTRKL